MRNLEYKSTRSDLRIDKDHIWNRYIDLITKYPYLKPKGIAERVGVNVKLLNTIVRERNEKTV